MRFFTLFINYNIIRNSPRSRHVHSDWLYLSGVEDCFAEDSAPTKDDLLLSANDMCVKYVVYYRANGKALLSRTCITKKLVGGTGSGSGCLFKLIISNSHSSSNHDGSSRSREMFISCTSRGVARAIKPGFTYTRSSITQYYYVTNI